MRRLIWIIPVLLLFSGIVPAQIFFPHRHAQAIRHVLDPCQTGDCGTPAVTNGLVQWVCAQWFSGQGFTNGQNVTNWPDLSPVASNGLYWTNFNGSGVYGQYTCSNNHAYVSFATTSAPSVPVCYANSNAWYSGLSAAQIYYVIDFSGSYGVEPNGWETLGSGAAEELWESGVGGRTLPGFGRTARIDVGFKLRNSVTGPVVISMWSAANDWGLSTNLVTKFTTGTSTVGFPSSPNSALIGVSAGGSGGGAYSGNIYEVLVYDHKLSATDHTNTITALMTKYGL